MYEYVKIQRKTLLEDMSVMIFIALMQPVV